MKKQMEEVKHLISREEAAHNGRANAEKAKRRRKEKVIVSLLFVPILLIGSWQFFESDQMVGLVLFNDSWKEYPEYYVYDTSLYLSFSILSYVIVILSNELQKRNIVKVSKFCFILSLVRIADYWLFHDLFSSHDYIMISIVSFGLLLTNADDFAIRKLRQCQRYLYR